MTRPMGKLTDPAEPAEGKLQDGDIAEGYDAFLSYDRDDKLFATAVQKYLESSFKRLVPRDFRQGRTELRICRDETDLTAEGDLEPAVAAKLQASRKLVVVCSPEAKQSAWVNKEIHLFRQVHQLQGNTGIIALLHRGDDPVKESAFPPALLGHTEEPLAVEFRKEHFTSKEYERYVKAEGCLRVIAPLLDREYPVLNNRHQQYRRERLRRYLAIATGLAVIFFVLTVVAVFEYRRAEKERAAALSNLDEGLFGYLGLTLLELRDGNLTGAQEDLEWATRLAGMVPPEGGPVELVLWETIAKHYWDLGEEYRLASNTESALSAYAESDQILKRLLEVAAARSGDARWNHYLDRRRIEAGPRPGLVQVFVEGTPTVAQEMRALREQIVARRRTLQPVPGPPAPAGNKPRENP